TGGRTPREPHDSAPESDEKGPKRAARGGGGAGWSVVVGAVTRVVVVSVVLVSTVIVATIVTVGLVGLLVDHVVVRVQVHVDLVTVGQRHFDLIRDPAVIAVLGLGDLAAARCVGRRVAGLVECTSGQRLVVAFAPGESGLAGRAHRGDTADEQYACRRGRSDDCGLLLHAVSPPWLIWLHSAARSLNPT